MTATHSLLAPVRISPVRFRSISSRAQAPSNPAHAHRDAHFARTAYGHSLSPKKSPDTPVLRMLMFGKPVRWLAISRHYRTLTRATLQGAGKGTLSSRLLGKYDISFLSAGDILRQNIADKYGLHSARRCRSRAC